MRSAPRPGLKLLSSCRGFNSEQNGSSRGTCARQARLYDKCLHVYYAFGLAVLMKRYNSLAKFNEIMQKLKFVISRFSLGTRFNVWMKRPGIVHIRIKSTPSGRQCLHGALICGLK